MKTSLNGKIALMVSEGVVVNPYLDSVGVWTIGVGHTAAAGSPDPKKLIGQTLTVPQVLEIFERDLAKFEREVNELVKVSLTQNEFDALVHFHYNTGGLGRSALLRNLNAGDKAKAWTTGFHGWLKPSSLKGRRDKERAMAREGNYGPDVGLLYTADNQGQTGKARSVNFRQLLQKQPATKPATKDTAIVAGGLLAALAAGAAWVWELVKGAF